MFQFLLLLTLLGSSVHTSSLRLHKIDTSIDQNCWILNTNNITQIGMGNCLDRLYYLNLGIGTPPQYYNFLIDTLRDQIWFPINSTFANSSQTFQTTDQKMVTYSHRNLYEGVVGSDIVTVLQTNISTRSSIVWVEESFQNSVPLMIDGLLGMGFTDKPNFLDNAASNNQIDSPIFAIQIGSFNQQSTIYYNELPEQILQNTMYSPVISSATWMIEIQNIRVNNFYYSHAITKKMIVDTGTSITYLNSDLYNSIFDRFFKNCRWNDFGKANCPCNSDYPTITIVLEDFSLDISPEDYFRVDEKDNSTCVPMFGKTVDNEGPILMGTGMMNNYVITFDKQNSQLGFNGNPSGLWKQIFLILQLIMASFSLIVVGFGIYLLTTVRYNRKPGKESKEKVKKKDRLLQLSSNFLQP